MQKIWSRNYILLCAGNFFQFMGHFILMATLPIIAVNTMGASKEEVGMIIGMYLFGGLVSRPVMGRIIDAHEKKRVLILAFAFFLVPYILYFFVSSVPLLIALRLLHGLAFGALSTATTASVSSILPKERMGEGIGYFAMCMTLGMVVGPLLGLFALESGSFWVFAMSLAFAVVVFATILLLHLPPGSPGGPMPSPAASGMGWRRYVERSAVPVGIVGGFTAYCFSAVSAFITLYAEELGALDYAPHFFAISALTVFVTRPVVGRLFDRFGPNVIIQPALLIMAAGLLLLGLSVDGPMLIFSGIVIGLGNGNLFSSLQSLAMRIAPLERKGVATSTYFLCFDSCAALGAFTLGPVAASLGYAGMFRLTAAIILSACPVYYLLCQRRLSRA